MGFTPNYETTMLILHKHNLPCPVRPICKLGKHGKTSQIKQKYQF